VPTGPEHYREGEKLLALAEAAGFPDPCGTAMIAAAQAHFTAAIAAATALGADLGAADWDEWRPLVSRATRPGDAGAGRG
jgi:hypothetical protein